MKPLVVSYGIEKLTSLLAKESGARPEVVSSKQHRAYFAKYFGDLSARTIVVERDYVDRDFLEDFAAYYVKCFGPHSKNCTRLHFFDTAFTQQQFVRLVKGLRTRLTLPELQMHYLGFVVVKPLPRTVVGRTCLRTYPQEGRRHFPATRDYEANLFGVPLRVNTLAFQEQDSVVAACATSALWSAFQSTGRLFGHPIPSPVEITKAATHGLPVPSRVFPNYGLNTEQMAHAIETIGLDPLAVDVSDESVLTGILYAYVSAGIPAVLGLALYRMDNDDEGTHIGNHAVTVTGFSLGMSTPSPLGHLLLEAGRIDRLYVHDDQIGPFARMLVDGRKVKAAKQDGTGTEELNSLATSWQSPSPSTGVVRPCRAVPFLALLPLYHKIRIPCQTVLDEVSLLDLTLRVFDSPCQPLCWDVQLTRVNLLKTEILQGVSLSPAQRNSILTRSLPRFLWRATARHKGAMVLDVIFDATGVEQASLVVDCLEYDMSLSEAIREIAHLPAIGSADFRSRVIDWFRNGQTPKSPPGVGT